MKYLFIFILLFSFSYANKPTNNTLLKDLNKKQTETNKILSTIEKRLLDNNKHMKKIISKLEESEDKQNSFEICIYYFLSFLCGFCLLLTLYIGFKL